MFYELLTFDFLLCLYFSIHEPLKVRGVGMKRTGVYGYTLIELMIVIAIVAFLSMVAVPTFMAFLAKAKRAEVYMNLGSIYVAQKAYWAEHGKYAAALSGSEGIGWKPEGYSGGGSQERFYYTYGFNNGSEGTHYFTGKLGALSSELRGTKADKDSFVVAAAGDIDGDGLNDILTVDQFNTIKIVQDDLV